MSKPLQIASLIVIGGLCVAVAVQTRATSALRTQAAAEAARANSAAEALRRVHEEVERLKARNAAYLAESEALRKRLAGSSTGASASSAPEAAAAGATAAPAGSPGKPAAGAGADFAKAMGKMFTDPDMKKMMRAQQEMALRSMYGELAKELGLTADQAGPLMNLLTERQMELTQRGMALMNGADGEDSQAGAKALGDLKKKYDDQLQAMLGDGFPAFQEYEKSLPDRMALQQYQQQLSGGGQGLSDEQRSGLLRIMQEERASMPPNEFTNANGNPAAQLQALASDEQVHQLFASQEELNRRVLARAGTVLNADQLTAFTEMQARMLQMQQAGVKMSRTMFGAKK